MKTTNHVAVVVAAIVFFALGAAWYTVLAAPWAAGIGKTMEQLKMESGGSFMPMVTRFHRDTGDVLHAQLAAEPAGRHHQPQAEPRSARSWRWASWPQAPRCNYGFEMRGVSLWTINSGYVLVGLTLAGAIIGGWRKKS